jgi:competence protein ComGC
MKAFMIDDRHPTALERKQEERSFTIMFWLLVLLFVSVPIILIALIVGLGG